MTLLKLTHGLLIFILIFSFLPSSYANPDFMGDPTEAPVPVEEPSDPEETPVEEMPADPMPPQPEDMDAALFAATPESPDPNASPSPSPSPSPSGQPLIMNYTITTEITIKDTTHTNEKNYEKLVDADGNVVFDRLVSSTIYENFADEDGFEGVKKTYTANVYTDNTNTPADDYIEINIDATRTDEIDETTWAIDDPHVFGDYTLMYINGVLTNASGMMSTQTRKAFIDSDGYPIIDEKQESIKYEAGSYSWTPMWITTTVPASEGSMTGYERDYKMYDDEGEVTDYHVTTELRSPEPPPPGLGTWESRSKRVENGTMIFNMHYRYNRYLWPPAATLPTHIYLDTYTVDADGNTTLIGREDSPIATV